MKLVTFNKTYNIITAYAPQRTHSSLRVLNKPTHTKAAKTEW